MTRYCSITLMVLTAALLLFAGTAMAESHPKKAVNEAMGILVTAEWLSQNLDDPNLIVLECTVRMIPKEGGGMTSESGRADYEAGHIPTAAFADLKGDLSRAVSSMEFVMPSSEQFCKAMGALGVGNDSRVVLYDRYMSVWAARVWWMLKWAGFDNAAILDGGMGAWTAAGLELSTDPVKRPNKKLTAKLRPELIAHHDEVLAAVGDDKVLLVDAMHPPHYTGQMVMYGRPGHIPGAINVPAMALIDETGRYLPNDEMAKLFEGDRMNRAITYCGAGVAASSNAFAMHRLGFKDVAVYMASLQEWAADPANPMVVE